MELKNIGRPSGNLSLLADYNSNTKALRSTRRKDTTTSASIQGGGGAGKGASR